MDVLLEVFRIDQEHIVPRTGIEGVRSRSSREDVVVGISYQGIVSGMTVGIPDTFHRYVHGLTG